MQVYSSDDHDRDMMASTGKESRQTLADTLLDVGKRAFDPTTEPTSRDLALKEFNSLVEGNVSWNLLPALNALIKPNVAPSWLQPQLMKILTHIPLRRDGVRGTLEFVFSVHPSSQMKASDETTLHKTGANITQEALAVATRIITSPPATTAPTQWFAGIAPQIHQLLDGNEGPELSRVAAQVVMIGILSKKQFGAPGTPGWDVFIEPLLFTINPSRPPVTSLGTNGSGDQDDILDLTRSRVLVSFDRIRLALQRLSTFLNATPFPAQARRVIGPIIRQLWAIASWPNPGPQLQETCCTPALSLLKVFFKIGSSSAQLLKIVENLDYKGELEPEKKMWAYATAAPDGVEIISMEELRDTRLHQIDWSGVQHKSSTFVSLMATSCTPDEVSSFAMDLLSRWMADLVASAPAQPKIKLEEAEPDEEGLQLKKLWEVAILQKMLEEVPEKLISRIEQVLELVCQILNPATLQSQSDDIIAVALSLLNLVITSPTFKRSNLKPRGLKVLETSLEKLGSGNHPTVSPTARNLGLLLQYRDAAGGEDEKDGFVPNAKQVEDRATYKLAISYITQADNPPPVRSEGLNLISGLILANSTALDVQAVLVLLSSLMQDDEDYINLRVIKVFTQLANKHPKATSREILDHYLDPKERSTTDTRLRFGEALLQVIERLGETFAGDVARHVTETLLSIAGRRGYRPQTEARQAREARRREIKKKQAEDAWDGEVPDLGDELTEEEQATSDILTQIVEGWESKRGSEDVRMRASALSILAGAMKTHVSGVGPDLVSASVDLCVNVLTLEPELEKGILRRAAVLLILSFVKALDVARQTGRRIGFGLTDSSRNDILRVLEYIAISDNDGLVQQHARDVIESLESWQMATLLPDRKSVV